MDDLDRFASLRPSVAVLDPDARRTLRAELFGDRPAAVLAAGPDLSTLVAPVVEALPVGRAPAPSRVRPVWRAVAAAAVVAAVVGAGWIALREVRQRPAAPGSTDATGGSTASGDGTVVDTALRPPHLVPDASWTLTHVFEPSPDSASRSLVVDASAGLDGPWMTVARVPSDWRNDLDPVTTVPELGDGALQVHGDASFLEWTGDDGTVWQATGWSVTAAQLVGYAEAVERGDTTPPAGFLAGSDAGVVDRTAETSYQRGDAELNLRVYGGGGVARYQRIGSEPTSAVTAAGHPALVVISEGTRQRVVWQDGFWVWEVDGIDVGSLDELLVVLDGLTAVDDAAWNASLPAGIVGGDDRAAAVAEIVAGLPLPDGFDADAVGAAATTNDRYQLVTQVTGAVVCAWLDQWFTAADAGDGVAQAEVVTALGTAHEWPALQEVASQGGWSDVVWEFTDSIVSGTPQVLTGGGPVMPTREGAASALGCPL